MNDVILKIKRKGTNIYEINVSDYDDVLNCINQIPFLKNVFIHVSQIDLR